MNRKFLIALSIAFTLVACSKENSITGGFGDHVLSGQIFAVGNLAGSSEVSTMAVTPMGVPASGVEVRVRGTGQATTTDASGRFALTGLPASVELSFTRSDGVNASAKVNVAASPVVIVELQKTQATVIPAGQSKRELEGIVKNVSSDSITVNDASSHADVTVEITSTTVIRHGNLTLQASQIKEGDRVHIRALINSDGSLTALEIMLQNSGGGPAILQLEGPIMEVSCSEITVNDASRGPTTAKIDSNTTIRKGNRTVKCEDLKQGDRVHVKASKGSDNTLTALEIMLQNPA